jgi:hypothetical protein
VRSLPVKISCWAEVVTSPCRSITTTSGLTSAGCLLTHLASDLSQGPQKVCLYSTFVSGLCPVLVLPLEWTHPENVTCQVSLGERNVCWSSCGIDTWAVIKARQLRNVSIELIHTMHKLMHADALGLLEHVRDIVLFLLSHVNGKHSEKVEQHTIIK